MSKQKKQNNTMNQTKLNANGHASNKRQTRENARDRSVTSSILHLIGSIDDMNRSHETITERSEVKNNYGLLSTLR